MWFVHVCGTFIGEKVGESCWWWWAIGHAMRPLLLWMNCKVVCFAMEKAISVCMQTLRGSLGGLSRREFGLVDVEEDEVK